MYKWVKVLHTDVVILNFAFWHSKTDKSILHYKYHTILYTIVILLYSIL